MVVPETICMSSPAPPKKRPLRVALVADVLSLGARMTPWKAPVLGARLKHAENSFFSFDSASNRSFGRDVGAVKIWGVRKHDVTTHMEMDVIGRP